MRKLAILLSILVAGCSTMHPFNNMPPSSGKLDKTPEVLVVRGQDFYLCVKPNAPVELVYFLHFRWMPGPHTITFNGGKVQSEGELTVKTLAKGTAGSLNYVTTTFAVDGKEYGLTTVLMDCGIGAK